MLVALVACWPLLSWLAARFLIVKQELPAADAIVVLSGSSTYVERTNWAARLFREGRAPIVIVTDDRLVGPWSQRDERNLFFHEMASNELQRNGVPASRIVVVPDIGAGTYQECERIVGYAREHDLKRLIVVTSGYHTRRALWSMRRSAGNSALQFGIEGAPPGWQTPAPAVWWLSRWGWRVVAAEYVKMVYYWIEY